MAAGGALDVRSQLRIRGGTAAGAGAGDAAADDGEYMLYHEGDGARPMRLYVRNARSARPSEFLTLGAGAESNFSFFPAGGSAASSVAGGGVRTRFSRVRVDPWSLLVKTDDYTFATTDGAPLEMTYWNGARRVTFAAVPYATARDSLGERMPRGRGPRRPCRAAASARRVDLSGTGFGVRVDGSRDGVPRVGRRGAASIRPREGRSARRRAVAGGAARGRRLRRAALPGARRHGDEAAGGPMDAEAATAAGSCRWCCCRTAGSDGDAAWRTRERVGVAGHRVFRAAVDRPVPAVVGGGGDLGRRDSQPKRGFPAGTRTRVCRVRADYPDHLTTWED